MTKKILLLSATLGIAFLSLNSNSGGPAKAGNGNLTGSPGSASSCSGGSCHAAGSGSTTTQLGGPIFLTLKSTSAPEASGMYVPGTVYNVRLATQNTNVRPKFGFQVTAVKKSDGTQAGSMAITSATNTQLITVGGRGIVEHKSAITASTPGLYNISFEWTAPAAGTGDVDFYAIVNAVDGTGTAANDQPSATMKVTLKDKTTSINEVNNNIASSVFPNPCTNVLNIVAAGNAKYMTTVYDLAGRQVIAPSHQSSIDVSSLTAGVYLLRLNTADGQQTATFVKQ
ncbi:MAG: T9SS type A sorting domain-containing protein [Chitinophagaceae bacterium]|nr:T9SS type A sorting domain-containing protein [Chitinophagaceae bacterium]